MNVEGKEIFNLRRLKVKYMWEQPRYVKTLYPFCTRKVKHSSEVAKCKPCFKLKENVIHLIAAATSFQSWQESISCRNLWKKNVIFSHVFIKCVYNSSLGLMGRTRWRNVGTLFFFFFFFQNCHDNEKRQVPSSRRGPVHIIDAYITALISM